MHQITDLAAAQRHDDRQHAPARDSVWPPRRASACNQNCNQGRACDCVRDVEIEDGSPRRQRIPEGAGLLFSAGIVVAIVVIVLAVHYLTAA